MTIESRRAVHPISGVQVISLPLLSLNIALAAFVQLLSRPVNIVSMVLAVLRADSRWRTRLKNLAVLPKAMWLATKLAEWHIDHIHAHWASSSATLAWAASLVSGVPWSFTAHRWDIVEANALHSKLRSCSFARCISNAGAEQLLNLEPSARVHVIRMGVFIPAKGRPASSECAPLRILVPANLLPVKGHRYLLAALALTHQQKIVESCVFAGDGPERARLVKLTANLGLADIVAFVGAVPHKKIVDMYAEGCVDVVALPSVKLLDGTQEGVPTALMEAMAYSVPVLSTRSGAIAELVDGVGILVEPASPVALADGIRGLVSPTERTQLGLRGRERVVRQFNVDNIALQLTNLIMAGRF